MEISAEVPQTQEKIVCLFVLSNDRHRFIFHEPVVLGVVFSMKSPQYMKFTVLSYATASIK